MSKSAKWKYQTEKNSLSKIKIHSMGLTENR